MHQADLEVLKHVSKKFISSFFNSLSSFSLDLMFFSFILSLISSLFSLLLSYLVLSYLVLSFLFRLLFSLSLSSFSVFFLCLCLRVMLRVMLCVMLCVGVHVVSVVWSVVCVRCGVARWKPPCVDSKRHRVYWHHAHMLKHMCDVHVGVIVLLIFSRENAIWNTYVPWYVLFKAFDFPRWFHVFASRSCFKHFFRFQALPLSQIMWGLKSENVLETAARGTTTWNHCGRTKAVEQHIPWNVRVPDCVFSWENEQNRDTIPSIIRFTW